MIPSLCVYVCEILEISAFTIIKLVCIQCYQFYILLVRFLTDSGCCFFLSHIRKNRFSIWEKKVFYTPGIPHQFVYRFSGPFKRWGKERGQQCDIRITALKEDKGICFHLLSFTVAFRGLKEVQGAPHTPLQGSPRFGISNATFTEHFHFPGCALWSLVLKFQASESTVGSCWGSLHLLEPASACTKWKHPLSRPP